MEEGEGARWRRIRMSTARVSRRVVSCRLRLRLRLRVCPIEPSSIEPSRRGGPSQRGGRGRTPYFLLFGGGWRGLGSLGGLRWKEGKKEGSKRRGPKKKERKTCSVKKQKVGSWEACCQTNPNRLWLVQTRLYWGGVFVIMYDN